MIFIWGSYKAGRTDEVPTLFYVATRFGHLWFLPLIPMGSYLLLEGDRDPEGNPRGIAIPFSFKSFLLGWMRAGTLLTAIIAGIIALASFESGRAWIPLGISMGSLVLCIWMSFGKYFRRASYERALELGNLLGLNSRGEILLDLQFRRLSQREASARMAQAEQSELAEEARALEDRREHLRRRLEAGSEKGMSATPMPEEVTKHVRCIRCSAALGSYLNEWTAAGFCTRKCMEAYGKGSTRA